MTAERRTSSTWPERVSEAPVSAPGTFTGVASGSLGTAANLEDTQVYELDDLQLPERAEEVSVAGGEAAPAARPAVPSAPPIPSRAPVQPLAPVPATAWPPVAVEVAGARVGARRSRSIGGGSIAAAVLVAVVGAAALLGLANGNGPERSGSGAAVPTADATDAPATDAPNGGGGDGGKNGTKDGKGNGGGNGNGNGNGGKSGH